MIRPIMLLASAALVACGGGNKTQQGSDAVNYTQLQAVGLEAKVLKPASASELGNYLKNGIRLNIAFNPPAERTGREGGGLSVAAPSAPSLAVFEQAQAAALDSATHSKYSATNTHVLGVDESDFVKYDGQYLYVSTHPEYVWYDIASSAAESVNQYSDAKIRILKTLPDSADVQPVAEIDVADSQWGEVSQLFLLGDDGGHTTDLITVRSAWNVVAAAEPSLADPMLAIWPGPMANRVQMVSYDLEDPTSPVREFTLEVDGYLHASRKIGNTLYLVTHYTPQPPSIERYLTDERDIRANEQRIASLSLDQLLPQVRVNGGAAEPLHQASDCYIPVDLPSNAGNPNVISLVAIDLASLQVESAKCINAQIAGIYSSPTAIYVGGSREEANSPASFSVFHKFLLAGDDITYRSTGVVPGALGWQDTAFRMDEHDGSFRVVTTERDGDGAPTHRLTVLRDEANSDAMAVRATLPNEGQPQPIGKPNEEIFAVRFQGERAFVVTFERTDPLYVLDLSSADSPRIAGELEVPGFSTYLHPLGQHYLLGIGQAADGNGVTQGLKTSLYDIRDLTAPREVNSHTVGGQGTWSPASYDLRAFNLLAVDDNQARFTLPISRYADNGQWQDEALHLYEVNDYRGDHARLQPVGSIVAEQASDGSSWPGSSGTDRAVLHADAVYYTHGAGVWSAHWSSPGGATGPH